MWCYKFYLLDMISDVHWFRCDDDSLCWLFEAGHGCWGRMFGGRSCGEESEFRGWSHNAQTKASRDQSPLDLTAVAARGRSTATTQLWQGNDHDQPQQPRDSSTPAADRCSGGLVRGRPSRPHYWFCSSVVRVFLCMSHKNRKTQKVSWHEHQG